MRSIIVITKNDSVSKTFLPYLNSQSFLAQVKDIESALETLQKNRYDLVFIDLEILSQTAVKNQYRAVLLPFWELYPTIEIVVMCTQEQLREAVKTVKAGANTYLTYPINPEELKLVIDSIFDYKIMESELNYLREQFWQPDAMDIIHTQSTVMQKIFEKIRSVAPTKTTVLLTGETGTGKGVLANLIHQHSNRRDKQFIQLHCGAIPDTLLESDLFGHEKGAFTGADRRKLGKFEIANGGTIFLDEIGTITLSAQIKLLQILQDQTFQRVGGDALLKADTRIIVATNSDLDKMCKEGQFRRDLYYRLNIFPIELPSLQDRKDDIPHILKVILNNMNNTHLKEIADVHPRVMEAFYKYSWPGNIREMENLIERAYILEGTKTLTPENFPGELFESNFHSKAIPVNSSSNLSDVRKKAIEDIEKEYLIFKLEENKGKLKATAAAAEISTRHLHNLMTKYGLRKEAFKSSS